MSITLRTVTAGTLADFSTYGRPLAWYQSLRAAGYSGVILNMWNAGWNTDAATAWQAGLGVNLYQGWYGPAWDVMPDAISRAGAMVTAAHRIALPGGTPLGLDLEDVVGRTAVEMSQWITDWSGAIKQAGFAAALYVGANQPLSSEQLYMALPDVEHYWRSCSTVPDVYRRGYQLVQECGLTFEGWPIDRDTAGPDALGGTWRMAVQEASAADPASSPAGTQDLSTIVADLTQHVSQLEATIAKLASVQQAAGKVLSQG